jgi:micrococcal nuclease
MMQRAVKALKRILLKKVLASFLWALLLCGSVAYSDQSSVTRVVDGDTIRVSGVSSEMTIRLVGIDAPETSNKKREPGQPFSQQSTKHLAGLVQNQTVEIKEYGTDRYGRILAVVFLDGKTINLEMVRAGLQRSTEEGMPPVLIPPSKRRQRRKPDRRRRGYGLRETNR